MTLARESTRREERKGAFQLRCAKVHELPGAELGQQRRLESALTVQRKQLRVRHNLRYAGNVRGINTLGFAVVGRSFPNRRRRVIQIHPKTESGCSLLL